MKILKVIILSLILFCFLNGCIKDDIVQDTVDPVIRITNPLDTIGLASTHLFLAEYLNAGGQKEVVNVMWTSSDTSVISIDSKGLAEGKTLGNATITVESLTSSVARASIDVAVGITTVSTPVRDRTATLATTSIYSLGGDALLRDDNGTITLTLEANYFADASLPGLYVYLSNSTATNANALVVGAVSVFTGAHTYNLPAGTDINAYQHILYFCKPFGQRVGHGTLN